MNEAIVTIWNNTVKPDDTVYIVGDFSLNPKYVDLYLPRLNGNKFLIEGNHDETFKGKLKNNAEKSLRMRDRYLKAGFKSIYKELFLVLEKEQKGWRKFVFRNRTYAVQLSHFPFAPKLDDGTIKQDSRYLKQRPDDFGQILLHGHSHCYYRKNGRQIDVGFDGDLKLWSEADIIALIEDKRNYIPSPITEYYKSRREELILKQEEY